MISILLKTAFWQISIHSQSWWKFYSDGTKIKSSPLKRLKNIGMVSEKLYRNTLKAQDALSPLLGSKIHSSKYFCLKFKNFWLQPTLNITSSHQEVSQRKTKKFQQLGTTRGSVAAQAIAEAILWVYQYIRTFWP